MSDALSAAGSEVEREKESALAQAQEFRRKATETFDRSIVVLIPNMAGNFVTEEDRKAQSQRLEAEAKEFRLIAVALYAFGRGSRGVKP